MKIHETKLSGLIIIEPKLFEDSRGYFFESYNYASLEKAGIQIKFVQDNQSKSSYGVIRGLHYQLEPKAQTKLVRVLKGIIYDVAVDIREGSPTFGEWFGIELTEENHKQLFIPKGFAHGFSVLSDSAVIHYKCDEFYAPDQDAGIIFNDPNLNIDWKISNERVIVSDKDKKLPTLNKANTNFIF
jgi:dTDP-4-dehydrorhamnose 3,5-epimerase